IKDTTFVDFGVKDSYIVYGKGQQFKMEGVGYRTCSGEMENEVWLVANTLNVNQTIYDVKLHVEIESQMEMCESKDPCFKDGFELFTYNGEGEPKVPFNKNSGVNVEKEKEKAREFFHNNFTYLGNITGNATSKERVNTSFTLNLKEFREITFGIKSRGGCGKVSRIKVYYYVCHETFIKSVMFKKTSAPQNGTTEVLGIRSCSANTVPVSSMGDLRAYCHSNGSWSTEGDRDMVCMCVKGYEPTTDHGCAACQSGWYKPSDSNEICMKCPKNTINNTKRTTCVCKIGHYKLPSDMKSEKPPPCYAPIKIESKPTFHNVSDVNSVNITWSPPVNKSGIPNEVIFYDILCYICIESVCNKSCEDLTYIPNQYNVTRTSVRVSGLVSGQSYKFRIFPKNKLNYRIPKEDWNFIESEPYTFQSKENMKKSKGEASLTYLVVIVCVACLTLLLVVFLIAFFLRKRNKKKSPLPELTTDDDISLHYVDPTTYTDPERALSELAKELDRNSIKFETIIGGGQFGDVYKGEMKLPEHLATKVAIKTLKPGASNKDRTDFVIEASVMGQFKNLNVITLEGVVTKSTPYLTVTEFMENGSLYKYLKENDGILNQLQRLGMARGVASGMEYLAGMHFVHRDLAARNVLVNDNLTCKVADFGLSRDLDNTEDSEYESQGGKIAVRWTAPEAITYLKFSTASDIWSYGILLWEIMSFAEKPYRNWRNGEVVIWVNQGYRLPPPMTCPKTVHELMKECWMTDRTKRPPFKEIVRIIDEWIKYPEKLNEDYMKVRRIEPLGNSTFTSVKDWLEAIKMEMYASNFTKAGYEELSDVAQLTEDELLKKVEVTVEDHRHKIYERIQEMSEDMKLKQEQPVRV
ncbi:ephrin type-B receptor 1 isoform X4, partial [Paramuricea clavata]